MGILNIIKMPFTLWFLWRGVRGYKVERMWFKVFDDFFRERFFETLVDLGAGDGAFGKYLLPHAGRLIGVDKHNIATKLIFGTGYYDEVYTGDVTDFKVTQPNTAIFMNQVLEHLPKSDGEKLLTEIVEYADYAVIAFPVDAKSGQCQPFIQMFMKEMAHVSEWSKEELEDLGFEVFFYSNGALFFEPKDQMLAVWEA